MIVKTIYMYMYEHMQQVMHKQLLATPQLMPS